MNPRPFSAAIALRKSGHHADALRLLRQAIEDNQHLGEAWYQVGLIHEQMHQPDEAERAYLASIQHAPKARDARVRLGLLHIQTDNYRPAILVFRQLVLRDASDWRSHLHLATALANVGSMETAFTSIENALDVGSALMSASDLAGAHLQRSKMHLGLERPTQAAADLQHAHNLDANHVETLTWSGFLSLRRAQYPMANSYLDKALGIDPVCETALLFKGHTLLNSGHPEAAIAVLQRLRECDPESYEAHLTMARAHGQLGHAEQTVQMLTRAMEISPGHRVYNQAQGDKCISVVHEHPLYIAWATAIFPPRSPAPTHRSSIAEDLDDDDDAEALCLHIERAVSEESFYAAEGYYPTDDWLRQHLPDLLAHSHELQTLLEYPEVQLAAIEAFGALARAHKEGLTDHDEALGVLCKGAAPAVFSGLESDSEDLRKATVVAIGHYRGLVPVQPLLETALRDEEARVRRAAVRALALDPDERSAQALSTVLDDEDERTAELALDALTAIRHPSCAAALRRRWTVGPVSNRLATAVKNMALPKMMPLLRDSLRTLEDPDTICTIATSLIEIGDASCVEPLLTHLKTPQSGHQVVLALTRIGAREASDAIAAMLPSSSPHNTFMQGEVAKCLALLGSPRHSHDLLQVLQDPEANADIEICEALAMLDSRDGLDPMRAMLRVSPFRRVAMALAAVGEAQDVALIEQRCEPSRHRTLAIAALMPERFTAEAALAWQKQPGEITGIETNEGLRLGTTLAFRALARRAATAPRPLRVRISTTGVAHIDSCLASLPAAMASFHGHGTFGGSGFILIIADIMRDVRAELLALSAP